MQVTVFMMDFRWDSLPPCERSLTTPGSQIGHPGASRDTPGGYADQGKLGHPGRTEGQPGQARHVTLRTYTTTCAYIWAEMSDLVGICVDLCADEHECGEMGQSIRIPPLPSRAPVPTPLTCACSSEQAGRSCERVSVLTRSVPLSWSKRQRSRGTKRTSRQELSQFCSNLCSNQPEMSGLPQAGIFCSDHVP